LRVQVKLGVTTTALVYAPAAGQPGATLVLAHGAGAGQRSPFIVQFAHALSALGIKIVTFNFLYTEQRRRVPDQRPVLETCYRAVIDLARLEAGFAPRGLFVGGKSMGGRIATHVAAADASLDISGLVLLGYPLHPPGRPTERRDAHLPAVGRPMLFVQGTRDAFGAPSELGQVVAGLVPPATLQVVEGGDHSFKIPGRAAARSAMFSEVSRVIARWIREILEEDAAR
jgi:hypothetical protein